MIDFDFILEGLITEGSHHKQWYLEQILEYFSDKESVKEARERYDWEQAIPP